MAKQDEQRLLVKIATLYYLEGENSLTSPNFSRFLSHLYPER